jgi:4-amino-4-deoxy-L-arabinose transferase-like glycosyltransferase
VRHRYWWIVAAILLLSVLRVASTWPVFSQTTDEPIHILSGFQWLTSAQYEDDEHPPLARAFLGIGAALRDASQPPRLPGTPDLNEVMTAEGNALLDRGSYIVNLAAARAGNLPFFLIASLLVALWTRNLFGDAASIIALALFVSLPPVLAHAGLATTDMGCVAGTMAALYALVHARNPLVIGAAIGFGLLTKFSFPIFFLCGAGALLVHPPYREALRRVPLLKVIPVVLLVVWGGYKFDVGNVNDETIRMFRPNTLQQMAALFAKRPGYEWVRPDILRRWQAYSDAVSRPIAFSDWARAAGYPLPHPRTHADTMQGLPPVPPPSLDDRLLEPLRAGWHWLCLRVPLPAPHLIVGLAFVRDHAAGGHVAWLLGERSHLGWWYYFPVVFFFKTPLAFLALAAAGVAVLRKHPFVIAPLLLMLLSLPVKLNIGVRHVLPLYPFLAICAAVGTLWLWRHSRVAAVALLAWYFVATAIAHPDYLAYFNEAAGAHPEQIALDSNLDWGQDLLRLARFAHARHIDRIHLIYAGSAEAQRLMAPTIMEPTPRGEVLYGWVAISEMQVTLYHERWLWLDRYQPVRRIGKSIRLYYIPPA